jgi:hypothetical protein
MINEVDFRKPMKYKSKDWLAEEQKMQTLKGKIKRWRSANQEIFTEVKRGRLFIEGTPVIKKRMGGTIHESKWTEFRYGKYGEKEVNKSHVDYLKKFMKKFKI